MTPLLRWLGRVLLVIYVLVMIVVLGTRYWLLPHIDQWRAPIAQVLSQATDSQIQIGRLSAQWQGLLPEIQIHDLQVHDKNLQQNLHIPFMNARIKWRSVLARQVHFSYLRVDGLSLSLWRDQDLQLRLAGQAITVDEADSGSSSAGFMSWLLEQDQIELQKAQLVWRDDSRAARPLYVNDLNGVLQHTDQGLTFDLQAQPQSGLGQQIQLRGQLARTALDNDELDGTLYVNLQGLSSAAWQQWVDLPSDLVQATVDTQFWLQIEKNKITDLSMNIEIDQGLWETAQLGSFSAESLRIFVSAPWESINAFMDEQPLSQRLQSDPFHLELYARDFRWLNKDTLVNGLQLDTMALVVKRTHQQDQIAIQELSLENSDFQIKTQGSWQPKGLDLLLGEFDLQGHVKKLQLQALYQYFPQPTISASVVSWLQTALLSGEVPEAVLRWQGNLAQFPYTDATTGLFFVGGPYHQADIDYYPSTKQEKGWPKVEQATGYVALRANSLWVHADQAVLRPNTKDAVQAKQVKVHIDDLSANEPYLTIQGETHGEAQAYLGLMTHTDLGAWLAHSFDQSKASGNWRIPLFIRINLEKEDDVQVKGLIDFAQNTVQLFPYLPPLQKVTGQLHFTEKGAKADNIKAQWLGGALSISDQVGEPGQLLSLTGQLKTQALQPFLTSVALDSVLDGKLSYKAQVGLDKHNQFYLAAQSDLVGLALDLPEPLTKSADSALPLALQWQAIDAQRHQLVVRLSDQLKLRLVESATSNPMFSQGSLAWQQKSPVLPAQGMAVDILHPQLDLTAWQTLLNQIQDSNSHKPAVFPDLTQLRIKANKAWLWGSPINQLTYTLQQPQHLEWRADISSEQIAGTVRWRSDTKGVTQGPIQAQLQRLHWERQTSSALDVNQAEKEFDLNLPDIHLRIDDLRLNRWRFGSLDLKGELRTAEQQWRIPSFTLSTPYGELNAIGTWYLKGKNRGLKLNTQIQSEQVGALLDYVGLEDVLKEGKGAMQAQIFWHDFPWTTQTRAIQADFDLSLHQGRINQISSRTAKILEFLSLQSLARLTRLDFDMRSLTENGFPFDDIKAQAQLKQAQMSTENMRVVGPVGTIVIEGMTDFNEERLDLKALVVPNLDMSGTAIAAGIALNPVVGIGAFITQLLFKEPLAQAMAVQYQIQGAWDQIEAKEIKLKPQTPAE